MRLAVIVFVCCSLGATAGENPTYEFLRQDVSPRASAMAGSFVSMTGDPVGVFYNPATIGTSGAPAASFGYTNHLLDINGGYASYSSDVEDVGVVGIGVNYINYGTFDRTDELANNLGTFGAGDFALSVTVARNFEENVYYGITGKVIYSGIADATSSAIAADFGILYLIPGNDPISLGASISNIGTQLNPYLNTRENLPLELKIGGTIKPQHLPLLLNINFHQLTDERNSFIDHFSSFSVGGEFTLSKALRFRFGYNNERRKELKVGTSSGSAGFSLGGGLELKKIRVDYSYDSLGPIGSLNKFSIALDI
ncbi:MAG: type IX secretion system protein PorQ [Bacteroidota bacterium]